MNTSKSLPMTFMRLSSFSRRSAGVLVLLLVASLALFALQPRALLAQGGPIPTATLTAPAEAFIGDNVSFTVNFDNASSTATDVGYGPYVDLFLPKSGIDGQSTVGGPAVDDGITFNSATYLGAP